MDTDTSSSSSSEREEDTVEFRNYLIKKIDSLITANNKLAIEISRLSSLVDIRTKVSEIPTEDSKKTKNRYSRIC